MAKKDFEAKVLDALSGLKSDVRRLEVLHEETADKIDQIIESFSPEMVKNNEQDKKISNLDQRVTNLELIT